MASRSSLYGLPARYLATPPTLNDGDAVPLLVNSQGALITEGGGGSSVTASNGLTAVGSDIQLGGTLSTSTQIDANGNDLSIIDSTGTSNTIGIGVGRIGETNSTQVVTTPTLAGIQAANSDASQTNLLIVSPTETTIYLFSPDGSKHQIVVDNSGTLSTVPA